MSPKRLVQVISSLSATAYAQITGSRKQTKVHSFEIKATYPHNPNAFTQGLEYEKICTSTDNCTEVLWESTGTDLHKLLAVAQNSDNSYQ